MSGINLHSVVRGAIETIHPDEVVTYYASTGRSTNVGGVVTPTFSTGVSVRVNAQMDGAQTGLHDAIVDAPQTCRFYMYSTTSQSTGVNAPYRPNVRGGDMIKRSDGTWWHITSITAACYQEGWVCAVGALTESSIYVPPAEDSTNGLSTTA